MPATLSISSPECGATYECQNHKCLQYFQQVCVFPPVTLIMRDLASPVQTHTPFLHRFLLCLYAQITGILQPVQTIQIVCVCACVHNSLRLMYTHSGEERGVGYTHKLTDTTNKYMETVATSTSLFPSVLIIKCVSTLCLGETEITTVSVLLIFSLKYNVTTSNSG